MVDPEYAAREKERKREYKRRKRAEDPDFYKKQRLRRMETNPEFSELMSKCSRDWRRRELAKDPDFYRKERIRKMEVGPVKLKARNALQQAVRSGKIVRPDACSSCGVTGSAIHGHHEDYEFPLEVIWLCFKCHNAVHSQLPVLV